MVRQRGLHIDRVGTEALENYGVDDNCTSVELLADPSAAQRARSISGSSSASRIICRRGLNVQWPFSQLILCGAKSIEVRNYALGHRCIAKAGEEVWIVETRGPCASASTNAVVQDAAIAPRRQEAHIVGCVTFSGSQCYESQHSFREDVSAHRIRAGGVHDWRADGMRLSLIHI